ncbi:MAG: CapA family protein [Spirochaetaceae bacterium]|nr:CapA family protein [Spirochaetaceae bacterium]
MMSFETTRKNSAALACLAWALVLSSCGVSPKEISLEAESVYDEEIVAALAALPVPEGWTVVQAGASRNLVLRMGFAPAAATAESSKAGGLRFPAGKAYAAAAVDLADRRYSVSSGEAESIGLIPIEDIVPPLRALRVEGLWPGETGYPFSRELEVTLESASGASGARTLSKIPVALRSFAEALASRLAESRGRPFVIGAAGDIQVGQDEAGLLFAGEGGLRSLLRGGLLERVRKADVAVGNLESVISARGEPNPRKRFRFRMPSGSSAALGRAGFDLLLFANNHTLDFGSEAFEDTLRDLNAAGMPFVGAGSDLKEAAEERVLVVADNPPLAFVGFASYPVERLGYTTEEAAAGPDKPGIAADERATIESIRSAIARSIPVVVLAHGGAEYRFEPTREVRERYARFVQAGAALVLGSHPHVLQGAEARSGSLIAYSLGNFIFTGEKEPDEARRSALLEVLFYRGRVRGIGLFQIRVDGSSSSAAADSRPVELDFSSRCATLAAPR